MKTTELNDVKLLTHQYYWDGPLEGLCEFENKFYRYGVLELGEYIEDEDDEDKGEWTPRVYNIREIEPWQLAYELYWHSLFCSNVKTRFTEFDERLKNERFKIDEDFYDKQKREYQKIDYSNNKIIGIFKR